MTGFGLAMIFATMTVYFRDTTKFLSYVLRIWLYLSPVLYTVSAMVREVRARCGRRWERS